MLFHRNQNYRNIKNDPLQSRGALLVDTWQIGYGHLALERKFLGGPNQEKTGKAADADVSAGPHSRGSRSRQVAYGRGTPALLG